MSLTNGLEYIHTTKQRIKSRLQGKGVNVSDSSPFRQYPDLIESELKNKSWQYPSDWYALTPKAEFPDHTIEMVAFDADYDFGFYLESVGTLSMTVYGNSDGGTYKMNNTNYNLNQTYTITPTGFRKMRFTKGTGIPSMSAGFTTFKIVFTSTTRIVSFYPRYIDTSHLTYNPILTLRIKDTTSYYKTVYFGRRHHDAEGNDINYGGIHKYMQYCDLSMINRLSSVEYQFFDCPQLVKCEVPSGFIAKNYAFANASSLREVIGLDYSSMHDNIRVFAHCFKFVPPSFNYVGEYSYVNTNLSGLDITLPEISHYPKFFITPLDYTSDGYRGDNAVIPITRLNVPDTVTSFEYYAFNELGASTILRLPSCHAVITDSPKYTSINTSDAFIHLPYAIENGENFYLDTPVSVTVNVFYGSTEVYLPHVPLRAFSARVTLRKGNLKKITFDWENTDFSTVSIYAKGYVIDLYGQDFEHDTLVELFNNLPTLNNVTRNICVTGNPGASSLTDEEIAILTNKGYVLTK